MKNSETPIEMELGIEPVKPNNQDKPIYRQRKRKFGRTYINILHDPRVVRGNTYAAFVIPSSLQMEFIRLKEEEERRNRMMRVPKKLPRVATLAEKKNKEHEIIQSEEEITRPESPILNQLDEPEEIYDQHYFFEDRPPTPKYVPLPPGIEVATQIEDGDLFDFDLEVEPILEVIVGRSLVQATYELIAEDERQNYLAHKKSYEREREFELINLQRAEAAHQRREDEKKRRLNQVNSKKLRDIETQKKLMSKTFAKSTLSHLKERSINYLFERGFLKDHHELRFHNLFYENYLDVTEKKTSENEKIQHILDVTIPKLQKAEICNLHKSTVDKKNEVKRKILEEKAEALRMKEEQEKKRISDKAERTENRRISRITKSLEDNILSTKEKKNNIIQFPLSDIDEFSFNSGNLHCLGGSFGLTLITLDFILKNYEYLNSADLIEKFLEEFLLNVLKENQQLEIKYMESKKFDFSQPIDTDEKRRDFTNFLLDERRLVNKSIKILLQREMISYDVFLILLKALANIYFLTSVDPNAIEVDPENQEPEYLESIKKKKQEITAYNQKIEKLKKKIKINFVKGDLLKKKVNNIGGFITINPNYSVVESFNETELLELKEDSKTQLNLEEGKPQSEDNINADQQFDNKAEKLNVSNNNANGNLPSQIEPNSDNSQNKSMNSSEQIIKSKIILIETLDDSIVYKIDYIDEIELLKNTSLQIDSYVLHKESSQWFTSLILISLFRVLKRDFNTKIDIMQTINTTREHISHLENSTVDYILSNESYLGKSIIPIQILHIPPVIEADPNTNGNLNNSGNLNISNSQAAEDLKKDPLQ